MHCCFRVGGRRFDVDAFLAGSPLVPVVVYRKGDAWRLAGQPEGLKKALSGFNVRVSEAERQCIGQQIEDAIAFLKDAKNAEAVRAAVAYPGVESAGLDFFVELEDGEKFPVQCRCFPAELTRLAGALNLYLEMSIYM